MAKAVLFTNWTTEDFTHMWDGVEYEFPKKKTVFLQGYLAVHFAKHLAIREMNRMGASWMEKDKRFEDLMKKCLVEETQIDAKDDVSLESKMLNTEHNKPAKTKKKEEVKSDDDSFEGLDETA